jgi:hypothetical protein
MYARKSGVTPKLRKSLARLEEGLPGEWLSWAAHTRLRGQPEFARRAWRRGVAQRERVCAFACARESGRALARCSAVNEECTLAKKLISALQATRR